MSGRATVSTIWIVLAAVAVTSVAVFAAPVNAASSHEAPSAALGVTTPMLPAQDDADDRYPPADDLETATPIKHFISVMQENHSFDNYFGTYPGADGHPEGACLPTSLEDPFAGCIEPHHVGGQAILDLGHSDDVFREQYRDGRMDGFVSVFHGQSARAGEQAMGYYDDRDLPFYWNVADNYVLFDRFFTSAAGGSVRNHFYWIAGHPGNTEGDSLRPEGFDDVPTIFDSLHANGVSWKYYIQNYDPEITFRADLEGSQAAQLVWAPVLNYNRFLDNPELNSRIVPLEQFFEDIANDDLPAVSYIVPSGASEHPPGSIQAGERFIRSLITSIMRNPAWLDTAFMWTYDDWGGWYDHVAPPQVDEYGYGFRAPTLLVSSYAKKGHIESTTLDFTSMMKFIEYNWDIPPVAERDAAANNILGAFDFDAPAREPIILTRARVEVPVQRPRTSAVYTAYGTATAAAVLLMLFAHLRSRRDAPSGYVTARRTP